MYKETAKLILYRSFGDHSILSELSKIFHDFDAKTAEDAKLIERIYTQIKALLDLATSYGFDENLWHNYLTFLLLMNENSFSLVSEKSPVQDGSVHHFAKNDFRVVKRLFDFDFHPIEKALGIDCFSTISLANSSAAALPIDSVSPEAAIAQSVILSALNVSSTVI